MRIRTALAGSVLLGSAFVVTAVSPPAGAAPTASPATTPGSYTAITAVRVLDTRNKIGVPTTTPVAAKRSVTFAVAGKGSPAVPKDAAAVVLNVTATGATSSGYVTAYAGSSATGVSNLNYVKNQTVPNLVVAPLRSDGTVSLYNGSTGTVHLLADLSGYYAGGQVGTTAQGAFERVSPAVRLLDTRQRIGVSTTTPVKAHGSVTFSITAGGSVPSGVSAVALNVTATGGTSSGYVTAFATGANQPGTSNLNYAKGQTLPALSLVRVGTGDSITLYNGSSGTVHLIADVQGYYTYGDPVFAGELGAVPAARVLQPVTIGAHKSVNLSLFGKGGVPRTGVSTAVLTVTVTNPTGSGYLALSAGVSSLNFSAGETIANLVAAPLSPTGTVTFYNGSSGTVQVLADVAGYALSTDLPLPATSTGHYVRNVSATTGHFADPLSTGVGCADARAGDRFVLLDIGAQANDKSGVVLSATSTKVSYDDLVTDIDNYLTSYQACSLAAMTVAVGTNNSGDFSSYSATARGADWANKLVDSISPRTNVTIEAANDIEAGFTSTQDQALQWETAFLAASTKTLVFNGSADGCPDSYGAAPATCQYGWTQATYVSLTHNGSRIVALPQAYVAYQARQWANIDTVSGHTITFRGSLTEHGAGCSDLCDMTPPQGWAYLYHALSTVRSAAPSLPVAADLDILN